MAILYKKYKIQRTFTDGRQDPANGKWFARAISCGTLNTEALADIVQRNCSMKASDVLAVIRELIEVIGDKLMESYNVKLDGLGTFSVSLHCKGAVEADEFTAAKNIKGAKVLFRQAYNVDVATGARNRGLLRKPKYAETAEYSLE